MSLRATLRDIVGASKSGDTLLVYPCLRPDLSAPQFEIYFRRGSSQRIAWQALLDDVWIVFEGRRLNWCSQPKGLTETIPPGGAVSWQVSLADCFVAFDPESWRAGKDSLIRTGAQEIVFYVAGLTSETVRFTWSEKD